MEIVLAVAISCLFTFLAYRQGIKDGQALKREETIKPLIKSPLKAVKEFVSDKRITLEERAEADKANTFYDG